MNNEKKNLFEIYFTSYNPQITFLSFKHTILANKGISQTSTSNSQEITISRQWQGDICHWRYGYVRNDKRITKRLRTYNINTR